MRTLATLTLVASLAAAPAVATSISVRDLQGRIWTPLEPEPGVVHVLLFVMTDCPVSNGFAPEIARIAADYRSRRVQTFLTYVDPDITLAGLRKHSAEFYRDALPAIHDSRLTLADAAGATVAPHAAVYTSNGRVYGGRVNDLYIDIGRRRRAPARHDLRDAIDAARAGRPVVRASTQPVGCFIERPRR